MISEITPFAPLSVPPIAVKAGATPPAIAAKPGKEKDTLATPDLILMGRDERGRPHASSFTAAETEAASWAAELMGLHTLAVTDALHDLAARLPAGRLFPSGRGFVPFVKADLYASLLAAAGMPDTPTPAKAASKPADAPPPAGAGSGGHGSSDAPDGAAKRPVDWAGIGIGSVVLACQGPMEGWWEAVVLYTKANSELILQWRDYPHEGEFTRARKDLGLLPLDSREGLG